ncbi:glutamate 5-kinase [Desulfolutivibrio sulfoxidireducens]|uniref:glutamate 5-kinase n=1 Tax=Desulfolutivibrio sulfoxidireducens TaxID=2773299 RepID=UPI00159E3945|nr:glutamate 5-kinase [Desulfolutivibrio sulfoxidireducens]QLA17843.1 glutamate 5-kinase [Desulfolutivibrio sulfoxidireducens]
MDETLWREHRRRVMAEARRVVVKVGSAVLAGPAGLDQAVVADLARQVAALAAEGREILMVSSGAVAAGRGVIASHYTPSSVPHRQAASAIGQSRLIHAYDQEFALHGKAAAQVLLTRDDLECRERYLNLRNTLRTLFDFGVIPVINENDSVAVQELVYGDNDCLAGLLVGVVGAELLVNLTSAGGVFAKNPDEAPQAAPLACIPDIGSLDIEAMCGQKTLLGTGGMHSKLLAAKRVAQLCAPTLILCGRDPGAMVRAFAGEEIGTWIMPEKKAISRRKYWLAYNLDQKGGIVIDAGAARALREGGKSLLPAGIVDVTGEFGVGAPVRILLADGETVGVGLTNYGASDLKKIMGLRSNRIAQVLGQASYPEAVHRDNMVLGAAV